MTIAGTLVRAGCAAARLPLDLAEGQLLGERRADWPPVLIFDTVESGIKQLVGSLTRDATLVQEGRLERARRSPSCGRPSSSRRSRSPGARQPTPNTRRASKPTRTGVGRSRTARSSSSGRPSGRA